MLKDRQILDADNFLTNMSYDIIAQYRGHLTAERFIFENEKGDKLIVYEVYYNEIHKEKIITFLTKDVLAKENLLKEYLE